MDSILSGLYSGDFFPPIQYAPQSEEYLALRRKYSQHDEDFRKTLETIRPDLAEQFDRVAEEQQELFALEGEECFMGSFCLGARLMMEIFQRGLHDREI